MGASLRHNLGADWGPQVWTSMTDYFLNKVYTNIAGCSAEKTEKGRTRKQPKKKDEGASMP